MWRPSSNTFNEPMEERFKTNSIFLVALTKAKVYKTHGLARAVNGVDQNSKMHDEPNIGKDLRALDVGKWVQIPDDRPGGDLCWVRLRVWVLIVQDPFHCSV